MSSVPITPARLDWPSAIGHFLLNYGTLDYLVFVFLKDHLSPDEFANVRNGSRNGSDRRLELDMSASRGTRGKAEIGKAESRNGV